MRPEIEAYLREHGAKYTTDALRRQLIDAGHDPAEVDAALREAEATGTPKTPPHSGVTDVAWSLYFIGAVVGTGGVLLLLSLSATIGSGRVNVLLFIAVYAIAYLGLGYVVARVVRAAAAAFEIRGLGAVLLGIGLVPVYGFLMFGTCLAASNLAT
jgi:hypothetical protein